MQQPDIVADIEDPPVTEPLSASLKFAVELGLGDGSVKEFEEGAVDWINDNLTEIG